MFSYIPEPKHIKDGFYAVKETGWVPVNKKGYVLGPGNEILTFENCDKKYAYYRGTHVHRIVAYTFISTDLGNPSSLFVNHLDGNKLNNSVDNLEWCTAKDNCKHAYATGLRADNRRIEILDIESGETKSFHSLQECARFFNVNGGAIFNYLNRPRRRPFKIKWDLRYEGGEWTGFVEDDIIDIEERGSNKIVLAESVDPDKKSIIFSNLCQAAAYMNISRAKLGWYLGCNGSPKNGKPNRYGGYDWYYLRDRVKSRKHAKEYIDNSILELHEYKFSKNPTKRKPSTLKITNLETGEVEIWESLQAYADSKGILKNTIEKRLWNNAYIIDGFLFEYPNKTKQYVN